MRLSPEDLAALTGPLLQKQPQVAPLRDDSGRHLQHLLTASLPKLWQLAFAAGPSKTDQRRKFLDLLDWFASKHQAHVKRRHPANYRTRTGEAVTGCVDAVLLPRYDGEGVAVELDFAVDANSAYKLLDLKKTHGYASVLVSAYGENAAEVRARVDRGFKKPTGTWLTIVHLPKK